MSLARLSAALSPRKVSRLTRGGNASGDVKVDAADEGRVVGGRVALKLVLLPVLGEKGVDLSRRLLDVRLRGGHGKGKGERQKRKGSREPVHAMNKTEQE